MTTKNLHQKVGELVKPIHSTIHIDQTVEEALSHIRKHKNDEKIVYFYAVDDEKQLKGVVSTRNLLLSNPESKISEI